MHMFHTNYNNQTVYLNLQILIWFKSHCEAVLPRMKTDILDWSCSAFTPPRISRSTPQPQSCVKSFLLSHDGRVYVLSVHPPAEVFSPQLNPLTEAFPLWSVLKRPWFRTCCFVAETWLWAAASESLWVPTTEVVIVASGQSEPFRWSPLSDDQSCDLLFGNRRRRGWV